MPKTKLPAYFVLFVVLTLQSFFTLIVAQEPPRSYVAQKANDVIHIDGKATEATWQTAQFTSKFIDIEGVKTPKYDTRMKMSWDDSNLYFYVEMNEPHVWGTLKERDTVIFYNNDFEVFIDPDGDTHNYLEFEMNALNTVWDLWLTKPYRNGPKVIDGWDIHGLKSAVHINGTLNNANDSDTSWSVEIAMPWKALLEADKTNEVPSGKFWRINFSRVNWDFDLIDGRYSRKKDAEGKYLREYNWVWSPQGVINMHEPEHWGYVYFSENGNETFEIPQEEKLKWRLYAVARKLWSTKNAPISKKQMQEITAEWEVDGEIVKPVFEQHSTGWNLSVVSPFTNKTLSVSEDGKFISKE
ncbi:carbohydrate-binding family 9-like protein [Aurantibacter crassamenti]|uniref:carbohydrate-binding family 9-like protein n=1 Tax=Aurantibacter crassamenti TaxID=1837375 RepID=UPI00193AAC39|nr:carbohydrate-binding family 9-like protein [Aurantibacter crassamenti]MBM1106289.1 carbohydrate-binding family 9-like protein [Aurantibacter crassamenti]